MTDTAPAEEGTEDAFYSDKEDKSKTPPESIDEEEAEHPTALIPTSALGKSAKVGDTITVKVVKIHGEEAEVSISADKPKPKPEPETKNAYQELDAMDS